MPMRMEAQRMAFLSIESFKSGCHPGPCLCLQPLRAKPAMWMNTSTTPK